MNAQLFANITIKARNLAILFLLALLPTACTSTSAPTPLPTGLSDVVSGKVDVGGYELYYTCAGKGSPTVILEAGGPSESSVWDLVRVYMGASPRVCAYDRANLGKSDSAPKPRTFSDMTRDLHTLLQNVPIEGPYVLVGHSMGGMLVQLYASQYPEDVVGLVLVDSGHPDMGDRLLALLPSETANEDESFKDWRKYGIYLSASKGREAYAVEGVDATISNEQVRAVKRLGDLPLAVVTRSPNNPIMVGGMPDLPEDINRQLMKQWQDMQTEFEGLSTNSTRFTAVRSGHGVQAEEPRLVVEAIRHVVDEYRARAGIVVVSEANAADASSHIPVITGITERKQWESGVLVFYEDIYFTDAQGDAITIINHLVSSTVSATLTDDIIREHPEQQKQGAVFTTYIHCRKEYEAVVEYSVFDAAGNQSNPETVKFSCSAPRPYLNPFVIGGIVLALVLVGLGIWLLVRRRRITPRNIMLCLLLALLLTSCATHQTQPTPASTPQLVSQNDAPVILQVAERTETQNGWLVINKDISFTDPQGDAVTVVHQLISTDPAGVYISSWDDVAVTASVDEQKLKGLVTSPVGCPRLLYPFSVTVEARIHDVAGNLSEPVTLTFACPVNPPNSLPFVIVALVIAAGLLAGFWLYFRKRPSERNPAIISTLLLFCGLFPISFLGFVLHEGGHALANLMLGGTVWDFYVHPFTFSGFVRPITDASNVWTHALGYITNLLVSFVIFFLLWKRRSAANLPLVMLFPFWATYQGLLILMLNGDTANIMQVTDLPAIMFIVLGLALTCSGLLFLIALFPLLGLTPRDRKSLLIIPAAFSLYSLVGWLVAHWVVPGSDFNYRYLDGAGIIESANMMAVAMPILGGLLAIVYVMLYHKLQSKLPVMRTETASLGLKDLRLPAVLAVVSVILGLIIIA